MAKQKTKPIPFANSAVQMPDGAWEWDLAGRRWRWTGPTGINLWVFQNDEWNPAIHADELELAAMFAEGFQAGIGYQERSK